MIEKLSKYDEDWQHDAAELYGAVCSILSEGRDVVIKRKKTGIDITAADYRKVKLNLKTI